MSKGKEPYKPSQKASSSGQFEIVDPHGGRTWEVRTASKGETLPPTPKPGQGYIKFDDTKNKSGKGWHHPFSCIWGKKI